MGIDLRENYRWGPPPERDADELPWAQTQVRAAALRILLPFVLAMAAAFGLRVAGGQRATDDLRALAARVMALQERQEQPLTDSAIARTLSIELYGPEGNEVARRQYEGLLRTISYQLRSQQPDAKGSQRIESFVMSAREALWQPAVFVLIVQTLLVLLIPMLFISTAVHARNEIARWREERERADRGEQPLRREDPFLSYVSYRRFRRLLYQEGKLHFWRRAGFAILFVAAVNLVALPVGLRAAMLAEYAFLRAIPGELNSALPLRNFTHADPLVAGFAGIYFIR